MKPNSSMKTKVRLYQQILCFFLGTLGGLCGDMPLLCPSLAPHPKGVEDAGLAPAAASRVWNHQAPGEAGLLLPSVDMSGAPRPRP